MKPKSGGNGLGKFGVHHVDMGGWVRVFSDPTATVPADFPVYLSQTLSNWFRERPHLRLRCVAPIQRSGDTVELHAWYDAHLFPPRKGPKPESGASHESDA
jgi:hypothetical protein